MFLCHMPWCLHMNQCIKWYTLAVKANTRTSLLVTSQLISIYHETFLVSVHSRGRHLWLPSLISISLFVMHLPSQMWELIVSANKMFIHTKFMYICSNLLHPNTIQLCSLINYTVSQSTLSSNDTKCVTFRAVIQVL